METKIPEEILKKIQSKEGIKLDLACGEFKSDDTWVGIDILPLDGVDIVHDLETYPWPLPDECCHIVKASHILEHIDPRRGGFLKFMDELWRVCKVDCQVMISMPYAGSSFYYQDPTHVNPCNETTWAYFDPQHPSGLWQYYRPKPWRVATCYWQLNGYMEVLMVKRENHPDFYAKRPKEKE